MKKSTDRMLTTHTGSLARPLGLIQVMQLKERGQEYDAEVYSGLVREAVADVVNRQVDAGVDIICDGEQGKPSFLTYVQERLSGFEAREAALGEDPWKGSREALAFPEFYEWNARTRAGIVAARAASVCTGPVAYVGHQALQSDIDNLRAALQGKNPEEVFMPAISPSDVEGSQQNEYYSSQEEYLYAIAGAMSEEYRAIVDAGFLLQVDDPRLVTYYVANPQASVEDCRRWAEVRVEAVNHALRGIPEEKIRFHTCYGINIGPRVHEMALKNIVDIMLRVNAGAYSFEAANPAHEHEWKVWETAGLPDGKVLIPGVISHSTNLVEHPELVAQRLVRYANIVGRENVIGGSDCGFSSFASSEPEIHPTVVWAKFQSMAEGARLASKELWG
ncbi:MAG: cobalamin-independent methionine synthase II family protein [Chloroflexi bacterium]|nr:cobalamin-independent methionine synthase II family protein [Chloroflexota bacterium]